MATYAIGDIQGCYKPLRRLLDQVRFDPAADELWCVGDLINRGPKSLATLRFLKELGPAATVVLGNHDLHFLAIVHGASSQRSKDTLGKLLKSDDCRELSEWLRHKPLAYHQSLETENGPENFLMVHAGVAPQWTIEKTLELSAEVEARLQGPDHAEFFKHMYGNEPRRWNEGLRGYERLRVITNYLTRLRFCDEAGTMNMQVKEGLGATPPGFSPWYRFEQLTPETKILFGHWAALEGKIDKPHVYALDTGCVWGRELTMMRLEDRRLFSV